MGMCRMLMFIHELVNLLITNLWPIANLLHIAPPMIFKDHEDTIQQLKSFLFSVSSLFQWMSVSRLGLLLQAF